MADQHLALKRFLNRELYSHEHQREMSANAKHMVEVLFDRYFSQPDSMPAQFAQAAKDEELRPRVVADYIAGMTDRFAIAEFERLN